jgi:tetratricopeptide (TPR) repeat protein
MNAMIASIILSTVLMLTATASAAETSLNNNYCGNPILATYRRSPQQLQQQAERAIREAQKRGPQDQAGALYDYAELQYYARDPVGAQALVETAFGLWVTLPDSAALVADLQQRAAKLNTSNNCALARPLLVLALEMSERALGSAAPQTLSVLTDLVLQDAKQHNIAGISANGARLADAWSHNGEPAVAITAPVYHALVEVYYREQRYAVAESLAQRALHNAERAYGENNGQVAAWLDDIASLQFAVMRTKEAQATLARAKKMRNKPQQQQNEYTIQKQIEEQMRKLFRNGEVDAAIKFGERELSKLEQALSEDQQVLDIISATAIPPGADASSRERLNRHANFAAAMQVRVAELYHSLRSYGQAEPLYQQALARYASLGSDELVIAAARSDLAMLYREQADYQRALPLQLQALDTLLPAYGVDHPDVIDSAAEVAFIYRAQGKASEAAQIAQKVPATLARTTP